MKTIKTREIFALLSSVFLLAALSAQAAEPVTAETSDAELVKHAQNPIANLISVPLQNNWYFGAGKKSGTVYVGNIEPVIPIKLNDQWNLITRTRRPTGPQRKVVTSGRSRWAVESASCSD